MAGRRRYSGFSAGGDYYSGGELELFLRAFFPKFYEKLQREGMGRAQEMSSFEQKKALEAEKELSKLALEEDKQRAYQSGQQKEFEQAYQDMQLGGLLTTELARQRSEALRNLQPYQTGMSLAPTQTGGGLPADFANYPGAAWNTQQTGAFIRNAPQIANAEAVRNQLPFMAAQANRAEKLAESQTGLQLDRDLLTRQNLGANEQLAQNLRRAQYENLQRDPTGAVWGFGNELRGLLDQGRVTQRKTGASVDTKTGQITPERTETIQQPTTYRKFIPGLNYYQNSATQNQGASNIPDEGTPKLDTNLQDPTTGQNLNPQAVDPSKTTIAPRNSVGQSLASGISQSLTRSLFETGIHDVLTKAAQVPQNWATSLYNAIDAPDRILREKQQKSFQDKLQARAGVNPPMGNIPYAPVESLGESLLPGPSQQGMVGPQLPEAYKLLLTKPRGRRIWDPIKMKYSLE